MQDFLIDIFSSSVDDSKIVKRVPKFTSDNANDDQDDSLMHTVRKE
jgi:hypothetical protein